MHLIVVIVAVIARATDGSVNPIQCVAHGLCAELLPEQIRLDDWGYPILDGEPVPSELVGLDRRAAAACPTLAMVLESDRK